MTDGDDSGQLGSVTPALEHAVADPSSTFEALFEAQAAFVWRTLLHFGLDEAAAEDATQDVFVVVHRRLDDYDAGRPVRSWLWGIARRVASTHLRGQRRHSRKLAVVSEPDPGPEPTDAVSAGEARELVRRFLEQLKPGHREVFILAEIEGASAPEIADALGLKVNTVYSRLRLTRARFQRVVRRHRARERGGDHG